MRPPEYPAVADVTPLKCSNTACTPQKQPPASTVVSWPLAAASGSSTAGFGNGIRGMAAGLAPMERTAVHANTLAMMTRANPLPMNGLRMIILLSLSARVEGHTLALDARNGLCRYGYRDLTGTRASFDA